MMTPMEILSLFQVVRRLTDIGLREYKIVRELGGIPEDMKRRILQAAEMSDEQVDDVLREARERNIPR